jgi:hypothetical protein
MPKVTAMLLTLQVREGYAFKQLGAVFLEI